MGSLSLLYNIANLGDPTPIAADCADVTTGHAELLKVGTGSGRDKTLGGGLLIPPRDGGGGGARNSVSPFGYGPGVRGTGPLLLVKIFLKTGLPNVGLGSSAGRPLDPPAPRAGEPRPLDVAPSPPLLR